MQASAWFITWYGSQQQKSAHSTKSSKNQSQINQSPLKTSALLTQSITYITESSFIITTR